MEDLWLRKRKLIASGTNILHITFLAHDQVNDILLTLLGIVLQLI